MNSSSATDSVPPQVCSSSTLLWFVAHTRARCEKKVVEHCRREGLEAKLPTYRSVKKYEGKTVIFEKPLFPGYVFLRAPQEARRKVLQSDYIANLLHVEDQKLFEHQLSQILEALEAEVEVVLAPSIVAGTRVRIKSGPLRGVEGLVEKRQGRVDVILRLDFISQAASVKVDADDLEMI